MNEGEGSWDEVYGGGSEIDGGAGKIVAEGLAKLLIEISQIASHAPSCCDRRERGHVYF